MVTRESIARVKHARRRVVARHPAQVVVMAFALMIVAGTVLLMLPAARQGEGHAPFLTALFTSTSAVCVTGLATVDTASYWSDLGQVIILGLIQIGGLGIMTLASMLGMVVFRRLGLRSRLTAAAERTTSGLGDVRQVVKGVVTISLVVETVIAVPLWLRFWLGYDQPFGRAVYLGVFHSVSAFNNAGFALWPDSLTRFATDGWICVPVMVAVVAGGLGFPVWLELRRQLAAPRMWSLHAKMTLGATAVLLVAGVLLVIPGEWDNPGTLGSLPTHGKLLAGLFQAVMPRTAGFNSVDIGQMHQGTLLGTDVLMFIGGGSAGTAGGIKVTTSLVLLFVIWAEVRGQRYVEGFHRRIDDRAIRQALTVALLSVGVVAAATIVLLHLVRLSTGQVLFEAVSAFATVGLSTGITASLPAGGQVILIILMFVGRLGPITLVSALALRDRERLHRLPEGRPLIG